MVGILGNMKNEDGVVVITEVESFDTRNHP